MHKNCNNDICEEYKDREYFVVWKACFVIFNESKPNWNHSFNLAHCKPSIYQFLLGAKHWATNPSLEKTLVY